MELGNHFKETFVLQIAPQNLRSKTTREDQKEFAKSHRGKEEDPGRIFQDLEKKAKSLLENLKGGIKLYLKEGMRN